MTEENPLSELANEPTEPVLVEGEVTETVVEDEVKAPEEVEQAKVEEKTKARNRLSDRLKKETYQKREFERQLKAERAKNAELMERNRIQEEPDPENYSDNETYNRDRKAYSEQEIDDKVNAKMAERDKASRQQVANEQINKQTDTYVNNRVKAMESEPKYREYEKSVDDAVKAFEAPEIHNAILKGDGTELVTYFGKNPEVLEDIALMSASDRMYELGKIASKVKAKSPKTISTAPKPTREVKASAQRQAKASGKGRHVHIKNESSLDRARRLNGFTR